MKTLFKILINGTVYCVLWIAAVLMVNSLMQVATPPPENASYGLLLMWLCCLIEAVALHVYIINCRLSMKLRGLSIFLIIFLLQFLFSQMETIYYLDTQTVPFEVVLSTVTGGGLAALLFSIFLTFRYPIKIGPTPPLAPVKSITPMILLLGILIYPSLYFIAGYFIAWQSEALRLYYSGSSELVSFFQVMKSNLVEGVYAFQVIRGLIWTILGLVILRTMIPTKWIFQGLILGLLFACLMSAQLLLPNPYMPDHVRLMHAIETSTSNFIWGIAISYGFHLAKTNISQAGELALD